MAWGGNSDGETDLIEIRQNILPILESHGVDLVLCGHSHNLERSYLLNGHYGLSTTLTAEAKDSAPVELLIVNAPASAPPMIE